MITLREATAADLPRINDIYNHYVITSTCTYQEEPETLEARRAWFDTHGPTHPVIVAEARGRVVGWGSLSRFRERSAYRFTVENSVYVDITEQRRGIGLALMQELIGRARTIGYRTIIAGIDADQPASIALHHRLGFESVARLAAVGYKFGRWLDVVYLQLLL